MAKRLLEKAGTIQMPQDQRDKSAPVSADEPRVKTAPGSMLHFMASQSSAIKEVETLREQMQRFDGALPVRQLDPRRIRVSIWANRHAASFVGPDFIALKDEIAAAGGNVQPIKVRPIVARKGGVGRSNPPADAEQADYEIVFGHRRHRACLELGLPVLSLIEEVSEHDLFIAMERENRSRRDLSPWEQGMMYARALDAGLYASNRKLAAAVGRDLGDIGKALALARLPKQVVEAFASPLDLQFRWAKPLGDAQQRDPEALLVKAKAVRENAELKTAKDIFEFLVRDASSQARELQPANEVPISIGGDKVAVLSTNAAGKVVIVVHAPLNASDRKALVRDIEHFFERLAQR